MDACLMRQDMTSRMGWTNHRYRNKQRACSGHSTISPSSYSSLLLPSAFSFLHSPNPSVLPFFHSFPPPTPFSSPILLLLLLPPPFHSHTHFSHSSPFLPSSPPTHPSSSGRPWCTCTGREEWQCGERPSHPSLVCQTPGHGCHQENHHSWGKTYKSSSSLKS